MTSPANRVTFGPVISLAQAYLALARQGRTTGKIAASQKRSAGYVSVVLFLGAALEHVPAAELQLLSKSTTLTLRALQHMVSTIRKRMAPAPAGRAEAYMELRAALLALATTPPPPPRVGKRIRRQSSDPVWTFRFDHTACMRDPHAYAVAHRTALTAAHRHIADKATAAIQAQTASQIVPTYGSEATLRMLQGRRGAEVRNLMHATRSPDADAALRIFAALSRAIRTSPAEEGRHLPSPAPAVPIEVSEDEINSDLGIQ